MPSTPYADYLLSEAQESARETKHRKLKDEVVKAARRWGRRLPPPSSVAVKIVTQDLMDAVENLLSFEEENK